MRQYILVIVMVFTFFTAQFASAGEVCDCKMMKEMQQAESTQTGACCDQQADSQAMPEKHCAKGACGCAVTVPAGMLLQVNAFFSRPEPQPPITFIPVYYSSLIEVPYAPPKCS